MIAWLLWLIDTLFGCSHKRTSFPITPSRRYQLTLTSDGSRKKRTYVVCLECGQEFDYNWKEMRLGNAVVSTAIVSPLTQRSANS